MSSRFDIERAVMGSELAPTSRHLVFVLCARMDAHANIILPRFQPSLNELARSTGYDRRTVMRHLTRLENAGWIIRRRPSIHDARTKHARTAYLLLIPGYPQDAEPARARGTKPQELGAQSPKARGNVPFKSSESSMSGELVSSHPAYRDLCSRCGQTTCICSGGI